MKTLLLQMQAQTLIGLAGLTILLSMYDTALGALLEASGETLLRRGERLINRFSRVRGVKNERISDRRHSNGLV